MEPIHPKTVEITMKKYQNVAFTRINSVFVDTKDPVTMPEVTFAARNVAANFKAGTVPMVKGSVALRNKQSTTICGTDCPVEVTEAVTLSFSVLHGGANLAALRAEVNRLIDQAVADYGLTTGLVPPVFAAFEQE